MRAIRIGPTCTGKDTHTGETLLAGPREINVDRRDRRGYSSVTRTGTTSKYIVPVAVVLCKIY